MKARNIGEMFGIIFFSYFMVYPAVYFLWNWAITEIGKPEYVIPGFWVGMAFFFLFVVFKNIIKGVFK